MSDPPRTLGLVTRRTTHTYYGFDMPGEHRGELRAWALDDDTGDWWGLCQYRVTPSEQMLGWIHETQLRRDGDLTDEDGRVG